MTPKPHTPASMRVRVAVRGALRGIVRDSGLRAASLDAVEEDPARPLVLVALSGGADSLALAAAVAAEAGASGARAGAVIVDHALQQGSAEVAAGAARQATALGLYPVVVRRVHASASSAPEASGPPNREEGSPTEKPGASPVSAGAQKRIRRDGGPEAVARDARYAALTEVALELGAACVLTAHTRDDQAEQVLLAIARGSGTRSLAGIPPRRELAAGVVLLRPLLSERAGVTREVTEASCAELGLEPWRDPHNLDPSYTRVRVRREVLPVLEAELGPGVAAALARTGELVREDAEALDEWAEGMLEAVLVSISSTEAHLAVDALSTLPAALRNRAIRLVAARTFDSQLSREHTLAIAALVTDWKGQGPAFVPGLRVTRIAGRLCFEAQEGSPRSSSK